MNQSSSSIGLTTKIGLVALALGAVLMIVILVRTFTSEPEPSVVSKPVPPPKAASVSRVSDWNGAPQSRPADPYNPPPVRVKTADPAVVWAQRVPAAEREKLVHQQAEAFRKDLAQNPNRQGQLTEAEINDMEKKGLIAW